MSTTYIPAVSDYSDALRLKVTQTVAGGTVTVTLTMQSRSNISLGGWHPTGSFAINQGGAVSTWNPGDATTLGGDYEWRDAAGPLTFTVDRTRYATITISTSGFSYWQQYGGSMYYLPWPSGAAETTITLDRPQTYTFTIDSAALTGATITASRTSSPGGGAAVGAITTGSVIYYGDTIKITYSPKDNYRLLTTTVNGMAFTSGNTYTVTGNATASATYQVLASSITASPVKLSIGFDTTISVTRFNTSYCHSLQYSFEGASGYITASGGLSATEVKFTDETIVFNLPAMFYELIPNKSSAACVITCRTYDNTSSDTIIGSPNTVSLVVTVSRSLSKPTVSGAVVDTNSVTAALTGDSSKLIRYKSTAVATITASPKNSATITSKSINGVTITDNQLTVSGQNLSSGAFSFYAKDSRGYDGTAAVNADLIEYIPLTINPIIIRTDPTSGRISMSFSGNFFNGNFGAADNTVSVRYRSKESTQSVYGEWQSVPASGITKLDTTYRSNATVGLVANDGTATGFDYQKSYDIMVEAYDGTASTVLSTVTYLTTVSSGKPIFDWSKDDFQVNVPFAVNGSAFVRSDVEIDGAIEGKTIAGASSQNKVFVVPYYAYSDFGSDTTDTAFLQHWISAVCAAYPNVASGLFVGAGRPNSQGYLTCQIYNTSVRDATTGLPQYCSGMYMGLNGLVIFRCSAYTFSSKTYGF